MNDSPPNPEPARPRAHTEYEDPHFHDEEPEIQHDETGRRPGQPPARRKPPRYPPRSRRHYDD
jgi:hypothetical protein